MSTAASEKNRRRLHSSMQPPCAGPKLHAFEYWDAPIQWLERLDIDRTHESGTEGFVFRVNIKSRDYALKVFKFFSLESEEWYWEPILGDSVPVEEVTYHLDPFYAECRAYGRIKEGRVKGTRRLKRDIAVPCHGFLFLKNSDKGMLKQKGIDLEESRLNERGRGTGQVRAVVKELVSPVLGHGISSMNVRYVLSDIRWLKMLKIYNGDVRLENFMGRKLVDFGHAVTEPHCILNAFDGGDEGDKEEARETRVGDLVMFDDMVRDGGFKTNARGVPNQVYRQRLRSYKSGLIT